jgi:dolichol-phosphate mannosyltransferase
MSGTGSLLIAIPTYNERDNVGALLPALLARYPDANVVLIDDNSPDGTGDIVAALARGDRRIHLIRRDRKRGLGSAYRAAFAWALEREYARVVVMDADYSHDPAEIARLLEAADRADVVVGSRYVPGGLIENWPWSRRALSGGANLLARLLVGREVHDWTAGFKCYSRDALASPELERIRSEGYSFQVEILFHCHRAGWKIQEVPITFVDRRLGRTKMSSREVYQAMVTLLSIAWRRLAG